jgi:hypothetical protein
MRFGILLLAAAAVALGLLLAPMRAALADTVAVNATPFPLASNQLFPARNNRLALKCYNSTSNGAVVITYASGYTFTMIGGAALWETARPPTGAIQATGTAGQTVACEDIYQ